MEEKKVITQETIKKKALELKQVSWFDSHFYRIRYTNEAKQEIIDYFPSTTTKLGALAKPFLIRWYGDLGTREATRRRDEASDRGTRLHWAWHIYITGGVVIYNPYETPLYSKEEIDKIFKEYNGLATVLTNQNEMWDMMKLQKFVERVKPVSVASEVIIYDMENREAGTVDNIFDIKTGKYLVNGAKPLELPGGRYIFDLKSGAAIGKEASMQVADYAKMAEKSGYGAIKGTLVGHTQAKTKTGIEGFSLSYQDENRVNEEYRDFRDIAKVWERNFGNKKPVIRQIPGMIVLPKKEA